MKSKILGAAILVLCGLVLYVSFEVTTPHGWGAEELQFYEPVLVKSTDTDLMQGNAAIQFPPSAREIHGYTSGARAVFTEVRFEMKANELAGFLNSTLCDAPLEQISPGLLKSASPYPEWFMPDQARVLKRCSGQKGAESQGIFVDMSDPETYTVYVSDSVD